MWTSNFGMTPHRGSPFSLRQPGRSAKDLTMPEEKGLGSKILGLFVESQDGEDKAKEPGELSRFGLKGSGEKSAAEEIAELARASGAAPPPGAPAGPPAA